MIEFACVCGKDLELPDDLAAQVGRCPRCGRFVRAPGTATVEGADASLESTEFAYQPRTRRLPPRLREATRYVYTSSSTPGHLGFLTIGLFSFVLLVPPAAALFSLDEARYAWLLNWHRGALRVVGAEPDWSFGAMLGSELAVLAGLWVGRKGGSSKLIDLYVACSGDSSDDMVGVAKAGVFDVEWWAPLVGFWLVFLVFLVTLAVPGLDSPGFLRGPWTFALAVAVVTHFLIMRLARHLFRARFGSLARRPEAVAGAPPGHRDGHAAQVYVARFSPDGRRVASGSDDGMVCLWDALTGERLAQLRGPGGAVVCLAFTPDGALLASGGLDSAVRLWSVPKATPAGHLPAPSPPHDLAWSSSGACLAGAGDDGRIYLWDGPAPPRALGEAGRAVRWLALAANAQTVAARHNDGFLHLHDVGTGRRVWSLAGCAGPVAFSPDGRLLAGAADPKPYGDDGAVRLWDARTGAQRALLLTGERSPTTLVFSPDGRHLAAVTQDGNLWVWAVSTGELVERQPLAYDVEDLWFDPSGSVLRAVDRGGKERRPHVYTVPRTF